MLLFNSSSMVMIVISWLCLGLGGMILIEFCLVFFMEFLN